MNAIRNSSRFFMIALVVLSCALGCKSKKKAMEAAAAAEKAKMEQEEAARKKAAEEERRRAEAEAEAKRAAEAAERERAAASAPAARLSKYFDAITNAASSTSADNSIQEALSLFASPDTPVLIVIAESGGIKDYDRPTTIKNYLNYLKDTKKNMNAVSNLVVDNSGKITEVELKKN